MRGARKGAEALPMDFSMTYSAFRSQEAHAFNELFPKSTFITGELNELVEPI